MSTATRPTQQTDVHKVYLAGKIKANDWRHEIFRGLRDDDGSGLKVEGGACGCNIRQGLECCGPFFISCDHGCFHGEGTHGVGAGQDVVSCNADDLAPSRERTVRLCLGWLAAADVVFCYMEAERAFGTIFELGYAAAMGKPIFLAIQSDQDYAPDRVLEGFDFLSFWRDSWFLREKADRVVGVPNVAAAWDDFVPWYWKRYVPSHKQDKLLSLSVEKS